MPRLPDKEALGASPEIASRPMASISATPAPDGVMLGAVADSVGKIGDTLTSIQIENKKKDDALDLVRAEAHLKGTLRQTEDDLRRDPDHATYQPRYFTAGQEARDRAAEGIKDPRTREMWRAKADIEIEQGGARINNYGFHRAEKERETQLETTLQDYQTQYANRSLDDAGRASILKDMDQAVRLGEASGLVAADRAKRLRDKYLGGTVVDEYDRQIIDGKARDVLSSLGWKPGMPEPAAPPVAPPTDLRVIDRTSEGLRDNGGAKPKGIVFHHTAGSTAEGAISALRERGLSYNYLIDRDGTVISLVPPEAGARHMRPSEKNDLGNANSVGISFVSPNNGEVTPEQRAAGRALAGQIAQKYGISKDNVYGHGELNSHKEGDEGRDDAAAIRNGGFEAPVDGATQKSASSPSMSKRTLTGYAGLSGTKTDAVESSDLPPLAPDTPQGRLTPHQRHALITRARNALRGDTLRSLADAEQVLYDTGKMPTDENGKTPLDHAEGVLDPNQIEKARARIKLAGKVYEATTAVRDMAPEAADEHLAKFDPGQNPKIVDELGYADAKRVYDQGQKERERTQKMREKDPAHAADQSREVADVLQRMQMRNPQLTIGLDKDGNPKAFGQDGQPVSTQDFNQELVRARLEAQDRYGIPEDKQKIINRSQAEEILPSRSFTMMKDRSFKDVIKAAADKAEALYGRKYSDRAMRDAISFAIKDKEHNEQATKIAARILLDGDVPKDEIEKYQALKTIRGYNDALEMGNRAGDMGRASNGGMNRPTRSGDPTRPAIDPTQMFNYSELATGYAAEQGAMPEQPERAPDKAAIEWLKRNPNRADEFDRQYGRFSAAKVLGNVK